MIKLLFIFNSEILVFFRRFFNIILLPLLLIFIFVLIWDPFKVFFTYDDYYKNNKITNNREHVCLKLFKRLLKFILTLFINNFNYSLTFLLNEKRTKFLILMPSLSLSVKSGLMQRSNQDSSDFEPVLVLTNNL